MTYSQITKDAITKEVQNHLSQLSEGWWRFTGISGTETLTKCPIVTKPQRNVVQIAVRTNRGLRFFEIVVREKFS